MSEFKAGDIVEYTFGGGVYISKGDLCRVVARRGLGTMFVSPLKWEHEGVPERFANRKPEPYMVIGRSKFVHACMFKGGAV